MLDAYLTPLEQLHALNLELYPVLDQCNGNLLVVGGQSVAYWIEYYSEQIQTTAENTRAAQSVDIDYAAFKTDVQNMANCWKVEVDFAENEASCSIAVMGLEDTNNNIKKNAKGAMFIDVDSLKAEGEVKCNIVDIIDLPAGFVSSLLSSEKDLKLYTTPFEFHDKHALKPHEKLKILSPLGCIKSRIANLLHTQKDKKIEITRINALRGPLALYLQDVAVDGDFKNLNLHLKALEDLILSKDGIQLYLYHDINLIKVYEFVTKVTPGLPNGFIDKYLPRVLAKMNDKYIARKNAYNSYLATKSACLK